MKLAPRKYTVVAVTALNLLVLSNSLVKVIMSDFTSIGKEMLDIAEIRGRLYKQKKIKALAKLKDLTAAEIHLLKNKTTVVEEEVRV